MNLPRQNDVTFERKFSLDWGDAETDAYIQSLLKDDPRRVHKLVAANPLAATLCFHRTVKLVIRTLFNCVDCPELNVDSIAARETPGIFGHVRAFLMVVEPQMRKALITRLQIRDVEARDEKRESQTPSF